MLVIDGKYNSEDGRIKVCINEKIGFGSEISGGIVSRRTRATKLKIQEFAKEKEDKG
jgi:hypothetical protein